MVFEAGVGDGEIFFTTELQKALAPLVTFSDSMFAHNTAKVVIACGIYNFGIEVS